MFNCINNFVFGKKENYTLPIFRCTKESSVKSAKELFNRSIKQFYIIILGTIATILIFTNDKYKNNAAIKVLIFFTGIFFSIISELNAEFLNISFINNIIFIFLPLIIFFSIYIFIINLNNKHI